MFLEFEAREFVNFYRKAQPFKYHNLFAEYFRATHGSKEDFDKAFLDYLATRYDSGEFRPTMQSWHKYLGIK